MREAYRVFDKERTGYIEAAELKMIFAALPQKLSEREIDEMLRAADEDGEEDTLADTLLPVSITFKLRQDMLVPNSREVVKKAL